MQEKTIPETIFLCCIDIELLIHSHFLCYNHEKTNYFPPNTTSVKFYKTKRNTLINLSLKIHKNMVVEIVEVNFKTNLNYNNKDLIIEFISRNSNTSKNRK